MRARQPPTLTRLREKVTILRRKNREISPLSSTNRDEPLLPADVFSEEKLPGKTRTALQALLGVLIFAATVSLPAVGVATVGWNSLTSMWDEVPLSLPEDMKLPQRSFLYDKNGKRIAVFYTQDRLPVESDAIPNTVRHALIATEDSTFYSHRGFDPKAVLRAFVKSAQGESQGGSGITQQYVKNLLVATADTRKEVNTATEHTLARKASELKTAMALEATYTKEEILTGYLNTVYFGNGAYGIGSASKRYFNKTPGELTLSEAALLIGAVNSPNEYDPTLNEEASVQRRNHVLGRMLSEHYITQTEYDQAVAEKVKLDVTQPETGCGNSRFPLYCAWVQETLRGNRDLGATEQARAETLRRGGLHIYTNLDPSLQRKTDRILRGGLPNRVGPAAATAIVVPGTGEVPAISMSRPYGTKKGQTSIILPTVPAFQQGSTFKPYTAVAAIESGVSPSFSFYAGDTYTPTQGDFPEGGFHNNADGPGGTYTMAGALRHSVNTWFVALEDKVGVVPVAETAHRLGLTSLPVGKLTGKEMSLTLGTYEVSPLEVANTYATIAAGGKYCVPSGVNHIDDRFGQEISHPTGECTQVVRPSTANTVAKMLEGVIYDTSDPGRTGKSAAIGRPAGGKTGTTDTTAAVWFAGFTPNYASAVWMGDPRGGFKYPLNSLWAFGEYYSPVFGGGAPAEAWRRIMMSAHDGVPKRSLRRAGGESSVGVTYQMPDVRGLLPSAAERMLREAGFSPVAVETSANNDPASAIPPGAVWGSSPEPGKVIQPNNFPRPATVFVTPPR